MSCAGKQTVAIEISMHVCATANHESAAGTEKACEHVNSLMSRHGIIMTIQHNIIVIGRLQQQIKVGTGVCVCVCVCACKGERESYLNSRI